MPCSAAPPRSSCREGAARPSTSLPIIEDKDPRRRLALIAARFFGLQPKTVVAVTGTNGKTSVASFVRQLWTGRGVPRREPRHGRRRRPARHANARTTRRRTRSSCIDPCRSRQGRRHPSCVRSFEPWPAAAPRRRHRACRRRLHQYLARPFGLSRELRGLFRAEAPPVPRTVAAGRRRCGRCRQRGGRDASPPKRRRAGSRSSPSGAPARACGSSRPTANGFAQDLVVEHEGKQYQVRLPLVGAFQASNALVAAGLVMATGGARRPCCRCWQTCAARSGASISPARRGPAPRSSSTMPIRLTLSPRRSMRFALMSEPARRGVRLRRRPRQGQAARDGARRGG